MMIVLHRCSMLRAPSTSRRDSRSLSWCEGSESAGYGRGATPMLPMQGLNVMIENSAWKGQGHYINTIRGRNNTKWYELISLREGCAEMGGRPRLFADHLIVVARNSHKAEIFEASPS